MLESVRSAAPAPSATNEPRDVTLTYILQFRTGETVTSGSAVIEFSDDPNVVKYGLRIVGPNTGTGTWTAGTSQFSFNFRVMIEHPSAKEDQVLDALRRIKLTLGTNSYVHNPTVVTATYRWSKLAAKMIDTTARTYTDAKTNCVNSGGFLGTWMKESERQMLADAALAATGTSGTHDFWVGLYRKDPRGGIGAFPACFDEDPDYYAPKCCDGCYYSYYKATCLSAVDSCVTVGCARMTGFTCYDTAQAQWDWDSTAINNNRNFMMRWQWNGAQWKMYDRIIDGTETYKSICSHKQAYPATAIAFGTSSVINGTRTFTATKTKTVSETSTETSSATETLLASASLTDAATPSNTSSFSESYSESTTISSSDTISTSLSKSSSQSISVSDTNTTEISSSPSLEQTSSNSSTASQTNSISLSETASANSPSSSFTPSQTNSSSMTMSNTSYPSVSTSLTAPTLTLEETETRNGSFTVEPTETQTATILKIVKPVKVPTLSEAVGEASVAIGMANPAVATSMARLSAAKSLADCGQGTDLEDEPSRFESPFLWTIGQNEMRYHRGTIAGVGVLMLMIIGANFVIGAGLGQIFLKDWRDGLLKFRFPSLIMLPFLVLHVPVATSASILALYGNGNDVVAAFVGGTLLICTPIVFAFEIGRRLMLGQCVLVKVNLKSKEFKESRRKWKKRVGSKTYEFFHWLMVYRYEWRDADVLKYERELDRRIREDGDKEAKRELKHFNKTKNSENSRYPFFGRWGEFFDDVSLPYFFLIDFMVATIQGISSGAAAQKTSRTICFVSLTSALLSCIAHTAVVLWKRPGISNIFQGYLAISSIVTLIAFLLAYIKFIMKDQFNYDSAAEQVGLIQAILGMAIGIVSLGEFFDFIHGLFDSLCCSKIEDSDSSDDEMKNKNQEDEEDDLAALIVIDQEEDDKEAAPEVDEEELRRQEEEMEMMEQNKLLLFGGHNNKNRNTDLDAGDDWSGLTARQKAFRLVRHFASDDPTFASLKTEAQREEDARRRREEQDALFVAKLKKELAEDEFSSFISDQQKKHNESKSSFVEDEEEEEDVSTRERRRSQIEQEAAKMMEEEIADFAAGKDILAGTSASSPSSPTSSPRTMTSPKTGKVYQVNFDSDFDDDDDSDNNQEENQQLLSSKQNVHFNSGIFKGGSKSKNDDSVSGSLSLTASGKFLGTTKSGIQVHSGFDSDFDDDDDDDEEEEEMRKDIENLLNGAGIVDNNNNNQNQPKQEQTSSVPLESNPNNSVSNPFLQSNRDREQQNAKSSSFSVITFNDL